MSRAELLIQVRELRARGLSPKQVAQELGMRPAEVAPLLRQVSGARRAEVVQQPLPEPAEREVVGCWVSPGWSAGLGLDQAPPDWAESDPEGQAAGEVPSEGLVGVMVARAERSSRVTVCGWLVDVFCLGVKNAMGPTTIRSGALFGESRLFFSSFGASPRTVPLVLAQQLVHGAAAYAASLGLQPHADFADTRPYLGPVPEGCPIRFGRDGVPFYVSGPYDNPGEVLSALEATAGAGNYQYVMGL